MGRTEIATKPILWGCQNPCMQPMLRLGPYISLNRAKNPLGKEDQLDAGIDADNDIEWQHSPTKLK